MKLSLKAHPIKESIEVLTRDTSHSLTGPMPHRTVSIEQAIIAILRDEADLILGDFSGSSKNITKLSLRY